MSSKRLALFDFDGTLTRRDTLFEFILFYHGLFKFIFGFAVLSPMLVIFKLGFIKNQKAKELTLRYFFRNTGVEDFNAKCRAFVQQVMPKLVRPVAMEILKKHKEEGATVIVISASPENWVKLWCDQLGVRCCATHLEVIERKLTGQIKGNNCYGPEKVNRIKDIVTVADYQEVHAYGDSRGDKEMLGLAHYPHYRVF